MKIALFTMGSRGDIQPFAVLGQALQQRGHDITLVSAKNFDSFIASYGLHFIPVNADFEQIINSPEGKQMMRNPFRARKYLDHLIYPMIYETLKTCYQVAQENDRVLFHVKAMMDQFAAHFPGKLIATNVVPAIEPTKEFINPVLGSLPVPSILNRFSYKLSEWGMAMMRKPLNLFKQEIGLTGKYQKPVLPSIYGISTHFLPQPADYPPTSHFTGFWMDNRNQDMDPILMEFISAGTPPILVTFGSMPFESKINFSRALNRITTDLHTRIIVVKGWGMHDTEKLEQNPCIKVVNSAPYNMVFPHVKAIIHHGGIGTIASCLKAGKPFFTCPVMHPLGDQYFWGKIAARHGVGLNPVPLKKLTESLLIANTSALLSTEALYTNSKRLQDKLVNENGVENACRLIEQF